MKQSDIFIVIVDISGYTRFSKAHALTRTHAEGIISDLLEMVIKKMAPPLIVNKLLGDAVLAYSLVAEDETGSQTIFQLPTLLDEFMNKRDELIFCNVCVCKACQSMGDLKLKAFVHRGEVVVKTVAGYNEIAGDHVILAHRMMKNSLLSSEYVLVTDEASTELSVPDGFTATRHVESLKGFGNQGMTVLHRIGTEVGALVDRSSWFRAKIRGLSYALKLDLYTLKRVLLGKPKARPKL